MGSAGSVLIGPDTAPAHIRLVVTRCITGRQSAVMVRLVKKGTRLSAKRLHKESAAPLLSMPKPYKTCRLRLAYMKCPIAGAYCLLSLKQGVKINFLHRTERPKIMIFLSWFNCPTNVPLTDGNYGKAALSVTSQEWVCVVTCSRDKSARRPHSVAHTLISRL